MIETILAITGKPGLYKLISRGNNMLIVESLVDGKRMPTHSRDKVISLAEVCMYTDGDDIALNEVLTLLGKKEGLKPASIDAKNADNDAIRTYFGTVLTNFDRDRVYPSDIRKLINWYNILVNAGITDFSIEEGKEGEKAIGQEGEKAKGEKAKTAPKQVKTQKAATASVKTGVGAKKG